jgi:hypothetical protein
MVSPFFSLYDRDKTCHSERSEELSEAISPKVIPFFTARNLNV